MTVIYTGRPAPLDGKRRLSGPEAALRAKAMACIRSKSTQCQGQVSVGLFFDGTGNNDQWVEQGHSETQRARNKHSNVARLFDAHINEPENGIFSYYIPGVGTPFKDIGDTTQLQYETLGMGLGYCGADRINYGIISILNSVGRYLTGAPLLSNREAGRLASEISKDALGPISVEGTMRWTALTALEEKLTRMVQGHQRKVTQINVSIFGFSRGAAQARACAFWLSQICERNGGGMSLAGVPLRIGFMGIFDTVAAVGLGDVTPLTEGHMAWGSGTQSIHPAVEDCTHFIALHEQRASFPLEAAVGRGNVGYPGMHSDVGGGYWPGEQGKAMPKWGDSPHLSQIPLIDMHFAAIKGGVPMMSIEEIKSDPRLAKSFATDERLLKTYNTWLANQGVKAGDIRTFTEGHAKHYIRWRASLHLDSQMGGVISCEFYKRAALQKDRIDLREADEQLGLQLKWLMDRRAANASVSGFLTERLKSVLRLTTPALGILLIEPGKAPLTVYEKNFLEIAVDTPLPPLGCADLFADYVHDSRAGFRPLFGGHEPSLLTGGYFRFRHVFKEEIHGESRVYGWANQGLATTKATANALTSYFSDLWDTGCVAYNSARRRMAVASRSAIQMVSSTYQAAEQKVVRRYQEAEQELYEQLAQRYANAKHAVEEYNSPEAKQRRQWALEAEEYDRMRPR
jgi:hypothetical protein